MEWPMVIRTFQSGDAGHEAAVYNAAAAGLPGFTPLRVEEVHRLTSEHGFDPRTRFYAVEDGCVVAYAGFESPGGRVCYPWCRPGHEKMAGALLAAVLRSMAQRKMTHAFAALRGDWADQIRFFTDHGFTRARDMVNFSQSIGDLPTMFHRPGLNVSLVNADDLPALEKLSPGVLRLRGRALGDYLLRNPRFPTDAVYVVRTKAGSPLGIGILIDDETFADAEETDPKAPGFRFGAFGTEGLAGRRLNGLFSFLTAPGRDSVLIGQDLLWYATTRMETTFTTLAAQAPSDAPHLLGFYERYFRKQGCFPVVEREIGP